MKKMELRVSEIEFITDDNELRVSGIVNKPNQWSHLLGQRRKFRETICEGVFKRAIEKAPFIDFLADHNKNLLLASTANNSLQIEEVEGEVRMSAVIAPTSWGRDFYELMKAGLVGQMSFGFIPKKDRWQKQTDGTYKRWIEDMELIEVTATRFGAYGQSEIAARGIDVIDDPDIPEDTDLFMSEVRAMDTETFEKFKQQLKEEILAEMQKVDEVEVQPEPQVEEVIESVVEEIQEPVVEVVEEQPQEEVSIDIEEEPTPVVEEEKVEEKPFDTSEYLEKINQLKSQKEEV